jgi:hypothetical protein
VAPEKVEALGQTAQGAMRTINGGYSLGSDAKESLTALRSGFSDARSDVTFCFQTIQSGIDGADRHFSLSASFSLSPDGNAVSLVIKTQNCEEHGSNSPRWPRLAISHTI